jgi:putative protease
LDKEWVDEVHKASHREFSTGFYFGKPDSKGQIYETSSYVRDYAFVGVVMDYDNSTGIATIEQRNKMSLGEEIEVIGPKKKMFSQRIEEMWDEEGQKIESAPHPQQIVKMKMKHDVSKYDIIRRERKEDE